MFGRILSWFLNDIIVQKLANNRSFQRLALKIDNSIQSNKKTLEEKLKQGELPLNGDLTAVKMKIKEFPAVKFVNTFVNEIRNEISRVKSQK